MKREAVVLFLFFFETVGIQKLNASSMHVKGLETVLNITGVMLQQKPQAQRRERSKSFVVCSTQQAKKDQLLVAASLPDVTKKDSVGQLKKAAAVATVIGKLQSPIVQKRITGIGS